MSTALKLHDGSTLTSVPASFNPASISHLGFTFAVESANGTVRLYGAVGSSRLELLCSSTAGPTGTGSGSNDYVVFNIASGTSGQVNPAAGIRLRQISVQY